MGSITDLCGRRAATSFGYSESADRSGTPSTGCPTVATAAQARAGLDGARASAGRYYTKRTAETWLRELLDEARRGTLPGMVRTGATFADAAAEFLRYVEHDRALKPRRSSATARSSAPTCCRRSASGDWRTSRRTRSNAGAPNSRQEAAALQQHQEPILVLLHGVLGRACRVWGLPLNPASAVERHAGG